MTNHLEQSLKDVEAAPYNDANLICASVVRERLNADLVAIKAALNTLPMASGNATYFRKVETLDDLIGWIKAYRPMVEYAVKRSDEAPSRERRIVAQVKADREELAQIKQDIAVIRRVLGTATTEESNE